MRKSAYLWTAVTYAIYHTAVPCSRIYIITHSQADLGMPSESVADRPVSYTLCIIPEGDTAGTPHESSMGRIQHSADDWATDCTIISQCSHPLSTVKNASIPAEVLRVNRSRRYCPFAPGPYYTIYPTLVNTMYA